MTDPASNPGPDSPPGARARDLLLALEVAGLIVVGVLVFAWVTDQVPVLGEALLFEPLVIIALVAVTIVILARALWPRR
ncbi:MAG TPA: hypothetical protein VIF08_01895 [Candidatus Limnocylindrales bacterium]|jgi:hypothetical protein